VSERQQEILANALRRIANWQFDVNLTDEHDLREIKRFAARQLERAEDLYQPEEET
jgi:hypothetical protein